MVAFRRLSTVSRCPAISRGSQFRALAALLTLSAETAPGQDSAAWPCQMHAVDYPTIQETLKVVMPPSSSTIPVAPVEQIASRTLDYRAEINIPK